MSNIRVLLIDDDEIGRKALARFLCIEADFETVGFRTGAEALDNLEEMEEDCYTAVVLDFVLDPVEMSGNEVLEAIKDRYPRLPVIIITGKDPDGGFEAFGKGAYGYMQRPIDATELINKIEALAEQDRVLREVAQDVRKMLGGDVCLLWQLNRRSREFRVAAWDGAFGESYRRGVYLDLDNTVMRNFLRRGKPFFIRDIVNSDSYKYVELAEKHGWKSLISIPLIQKDQVIGFIDSYTHAEYEFASEDERKRWLGDILPAFAHQATEAIRNAELSKKRQALQDINRVLGGSFEEGTVIHQILSKALALVDADFGWLYFADPGTKQLEAADWIGIPDELVDKHRNFGDGITGLAAEMGQTKNVSDVSKEKHHKLTPNVEVKSEIAVPLRREEQTIGVLTAKSRSKDAFVDDDEDLLLSLASQAVVVIERAKLTKHLQKISALALVGDFKEVASYVVEAAHDLTGAEVILWKVSKSEQVLRFADSTGDFGNDYIESARILLDPKKSITGVALERESPVVIADILADKYDDPEIPRFYNIEEAKKRGWHSFLTAPLLGQEGEPLGSLSLYSEEMNKFGGPEVELFQTFANQSAIAIENTRFLNNLDALNKIGQYLTSSIELSEDQILNRIYQQAKPLMDTDNMYIALYEPDPEHPDEPGASEDREIHGTVYFGLARQDGRSVYTEKEEGWGARKAGHGLTEYVIRTKKPYCPDDVEKAYNTIATDYIQNIPESWLGVPMMVENRVLGVVVLRNEQQANVYDADDLEVLQTIASQSAIALRNTRLIQDLKESNEELEALRELQEDLSGPLSI